MDGGDGRVRGEMWGMPPGRAKKSLGPQSEAGDSGVLMAGMSDELDLLIANEVRKVFIRACQRAVMIMHEPKVGFTLFAHTVPRLPWPPTVHPKPDTVCSYCVPPLAWAARLLSIQNFRSIRIDNMVI